MWRQLSACAAACVLVLAGQAAGASSTGRCGGVGGPKAKQLSCPDGQYVVGLRARGASYVDQVGVACAAFGSDGKRGSVGAWMTGGGSGGTASDDAVCGSDRAVGTVKLKSGIYVDRVSKIVCETRKADGGFDGHGAASLTLGSSGIGGGGGFDCSLQCPSNEALVGVIITFGGWADSLRGECQP
jgi:hypothetical protein